MGIRVQGYRWSVLDAMLKEIRKISSLLSLFESSVLKKLSQKQSTKIYILPNSTNDLFSS